MMVAPLSLAATDSTDTEIDRAWRSGGRREVGHLRSAMAFSTVFSMADLSISAKAGFWRPRKNGS